MTKGVGSLHVLRLSVLLHDCLVVLEGAPCILDKEGVHESYRRGVFELDVVVLIFLLLLRRSSLLSSSWLRSLYNCHVLRTLHGHLLTNLEWRFSSNSIGAIASLVVGRELCWACVCCSIQVRTALSHVFKHVRPLFGFEAVGCHVLLLLGDLMDAGKDNHVMFIDTSTVARSFVDGSLITFKFLPCVSNQVKAPEVLQLLVVFILTSKNVHFSFVNAC